MFFRVHSNSNVNYAKKSYVFATIFVICFYSVSFAQTVTIRAGSKFGVSPGSIIEIPISCETDRQLGGFELVVQYDKSNIQYLSASRDTGISKWEYFSVSHDFATGSVRFLALANNLPPELPDSQDYVPKGSIARLRLFVSPDFYTDSAHTRISFYWGDCGDNGIASRSGETLMVVRRVLDENEALLWDESDNINFPESQRKPNLGLPDSCFVAGGYLETQIDYHYGQITNFAVCGSVDGNGSVDISDIVYLISFIFAGGPPPEPLSSGDVDCSTSTDISDAVWLIDYIFASGNKPCDCH